MKSKKTSPGFTRARRRVPLTILGVILASLSGPTQLVFGESKDPLVKFFPIPATAESLESFLAPVELFFNPFSASVGTTKMKR